MQDETELSRVTRSREEAKISYNKISKWYDIMAGPFEKKYRKAGLQKLSAGEGEIVLEVGFGTGHSILDLAQSVGASGKVYGIDISERMFDISQSRVEKAGLSKRVDLKCGDAYSLPFESEMFDAAFMSFTLELFDTPEIPVVLLECQRVLSADGRLSVVALSRKKKISVKLYEWFHKKFPKHVDCRPIFVQKMLEEADFQILDAAEMSMFGLPVEIVLAKKV